MPPQGSFARQGRAATMMGRRPQSSDGNALFHAALRKRNEDMSTRDSRVVHKNDEDENQFLPPLPQYFWTRVLMTSMTLILMMMNNCF